MFLNETKYSDFQKPNMLRICQITKLQSYSVKTFIISNLLIAKFSSLTHYQKTPNEKTFFIK